MKNFKNHERMLKYYTFTKLIAFRVWRRIERMMDENYYQLTNEQREYNIRDLNDFLHLSADEYDSLNKLQKISFTLWEKLWGIILIIGGFFIFFLVLNTNGSIFDFVFLFIYLLFVILFGIPFLFSNYSSKRSQKGKILTRIVSGLFFQSVKNNLTEKKIAVDIKDTDPIHKLGGSVSCRLNFVLELKKLGDIELSVFFLFDESLWLILEWDVLKTQMPCDWELKMISPNELKLEDAYYSIYSLNNWNFNTIPSKIDLIPLFDNLINNWEKNPLSKPLINLLCNSKIKFRIEIQHGRNRLIFRQEKFSGYEEDIYIIENLFRNVIQLIPEYNIFITDHIDNIYRNWLNMLNIDY